MESILHSTVFSFNSSVDYSTGSIVSRQFVKNNYGTVTLFAFDQGQSLSEHTAPFDALVQVVDGTAEISINKQKYILQSGESIIMPADVPHAVSAPVRFKMLLVMIKG